MNISTNYQRLLANPLPYDMKRANYYVFGEYIIIESVADYLTRIIVDIRDANPVTMLIPKVGYSSLGSYLLASFDTVRQNYDVYLYAFIGGMQDVNFIPVLKLGDEFLNLDQSTPQTVVNGSPTFDEGLILGATPDVSTPTPRRLYWDIDNETFAFELPDGGIIQVNQEPFDYYHNLEGATIYNGDIVSTCGASGNRTAICLTDATNDTKSLAVLGMVTVSSILNNNVGRITKSGGKVRTLNTIAYTEGTVLYVDPLNKGKWTNIMPAAPNRVVKIGTVSVSHATNGVVELDLQVLPRMTELADVDGTPLTTDGQIPNWHNSTKVFDFDKNINDYFEKEGLELSKQLSGFVDGDNISITYSHTDRKITLSGDLTYLWRGETKSLSSPWTSVAHTATPGMWFLSSIDGINFTWSNSVWNFYDIQVSMVKYSASASDSFATKETHGLMDWESHEELHSQLGTYRVSGGQVTAGTITENLDTDTAVTPGFDAAVIKDEDVSTTIPAWTQGAYTTMYVDVGGVNTFSTTQVRPFHAGIGEYIYINNPSTGSFTQGINDRFYNIYQILLPATADSDSQKYRTIILQPQAAFLSQSAAQAEDPRTLNLGNLPNLAPEFVLYTRITYKTLADYTNNGKCIIPTGGVTYVIGNRAGQVNVTGFSANNHQSLSNLDWLNSGHLSSAANKIAAFGGSNQTIEIEDNSSNWNTAYTDRLKWDGGSTGLTASTGRTSLGGTTIGQNVFTLTNPSAITFPRFNADNTVSALSSEDFKAAIGVSGGSQNPVGTIGAQEGHLTPGLTGSLSGASGLLQGLLAVGTLTSQSGTSSPFLKYQPSGSYQDPMGFFTNTTYGITASAKPVFYTRFSRQTSTPYYNLKIGLSSEGIDNAGYSSSQSNIILKYNYATDTTLKFAVSNGSAATVVDTGIAWTTEIYTVFIDASNPASIIMKLYDDDKTELFSTTVTTNIPTAKLGFVFKMYDYAYGTNYSLYLYAAKIVTQL